MAEQQSTSLNNNIDNDKIYPIKSIGYVDGYAIDSPRKSGGPDEDGFRGKNITIDGAKAKVKGTPSYLFIDRQSNEFRKVKGYDNNINNYEDPTFLVFDIYIEKETSSLFREDVIKRFIDDYSDDIPELKEREGYWEEFTNRLFEIFPYDGQVSGFKKHYIESIGNLNVLMKPIINYPEDNITFTITEDISMRLQYLSELYNNLIYSYDTHRYLIPDNLLRFNMRITLRDLRNFKKKSNKSEITNTIVNDDVSKFIYILHDCQLNFFDTKNFGDDMRIAGFGAPQISDPANGTFSINFKSYSKITAPLLINNNKIIDFRERIIKNNEYYRDMFNDYKNSDEVIEELKRDNEIKNVEYRTTSDINEGELNNIPGLQIPDVNSSIRGWGNIIKEEIKDTRNVIIKQIYEEVNQLTTAGQRWLNDKVGFTIGKVNVYYDSLEEKVTSFSFLFEDFLDDTIDNWKGHQDSVKAKLSKENRYDDSTGNIQNINSYGITNVYEQNATEITNDYEPLNDLEYIDDVHPDGQYNEKDPNDDINNLYNEDVTDNTNEYEPLNELEYINDVHPDGQYNEKYPDKNDDVHPDGQYNIKFPKGDVHPDGQYNEKYPEGDVNIDGQYNIKFPEGDVHPDGQYNNKQPDGNVNLNKQKYNNKNPKGNVY